MIYLGFAALSGWVLKSKTPIVAFPDNNPIHPVELRGFYRSGISFWLIFTDKVLRVLQHRQPDHLTHSFLMVETFFLVS